MENNEIMNNNEEVIETTTEEIVKAASNGGMKKATTIGLAMIAGALTYKFVVVPATAKFKNWVCIRPWKIYISWRRSRRGRICAGRTRNVWKCSTPGYFFNASA